MIDQIEYLVVAFDEEGKKVRLSLRQADILQALAMDEKLSQEGGAVPEIQNVQR
jgi:glutamate--cysteine ligase catalytic subunit